jgi:uncharacterized membrane protein YozB (DUF420 family)
MTHPIPPAWRLPCLLIGLSLVPFAATANRLVQMLSSDVPPGLDAIRCHGLWSPLTLHMLTGALFLALAAVQFSPELRARRRAWHRNAGRVAVLAGIVSGVTGIWLIAACPPGQFATPVQNGVRLGAGLGLAVSLLLAFRAIRRRDFADHRAWMIRGFALGVAGTAQAVLIGLWVAAVDPLTPQSATALITLGFALPLAVAEARIRASRPTSQTPA